MTLQDVSRSPETTARYNAVVNSTMFAGFSMLIYDHLITIDNEVNLIWRKPKSVVTAIFLLNRYIPPCILIVDTYDKLSPTGHSAMFCKAWILLQSYLTIICYVSIHAVVAIRVNAIHNGQRLVRKILWTGGIFYALSTFVFMTAMYWEIIGSRLFNFSVHNI